MPALSLSSSSPTTLPVAGKTVLVVEDIAEQMNVLVTLLRYSGYEVLEAADGEETIRLARARRPDLILMDAGLPRLDGWQATERLKQDPGTSEIPVVMLTAYAIEGNRERAFQAGCDSYVPRPVAPRDVLEEVHEWIGPA